MVWSTPKWLGEPNPDHLRPRSFFASSAYTHQMKNQIRRARTPYRRSSRAFRHYRFSVERRTIYFMLGLSVEALPDGGLKVSGLFGEEPVIWEEKETSTR